MVESVAWRAVGYGQSSVQLMERYLRRLRLVRTAPYRLGDGMEVYAVMRMDGVVEVRWPGRIDWWQGRVPRNLRPVCGEDAAWFDWLEVPVSVMTPLGVRARRVSVLMRTPPLMQAWVRTMDVRWQPARLPVKVKAWLWAYHVRQEV